MSKPVWERKETYEMNSLELIEYIVWLRAELNRAESLPLLLKGAIAYADEYANKLITTSTIVKFIEMMEIRDEQSN